MWAVLTFLWGAEAAACTCIQLPATRTVLTPATHADPDAPIRVSLRGGWLGALGDRAEADYRLVRATDGHPIALDGDLVGTLLDLHPGEPLQPDTDYILEARQGWLQGRPLLEAALRTALKAPARPDLTLAWTPAHRFTTGPGECLPEPDAPQLLSAFKSVEHSGGTCGPFELVWGTVDGGPSWLPGDIVVVEVENQGVVWRGGPGSFRAGDALCEPDPVHVEWADDLRVRAWLERPDGQRSPPSDWLGAIPNDAYRNGPQRAPDDHTRQWSWWLADDNAMAGVLATLPVHERPPVGAPADLCPGGLEREPVCTIAALEDRAYSPRTPLYTTGASLWTFVRTADERRHVVGLVGEPPQLPPMLPFAVMHIDQDGVVVVNYDDTCTPAHHPYSKLVGVRSDEAVLTVTAASADQQWTTTLEAPGRDARPKGVGAAGSRIVVVWTAFAEPTSVVRWTVLDRHSGAVLHTGQPSEVAGLTIPEGGLVVVERVDSDGETVVASARLQTEGREDRFTLTWTDAGPPIPAKAGQLWRRVGSGLSGACSVADGCTVAAVDLNGQPTGLQWTLPDALPAGSWQLQTAETDGALWAVVKARWQRSWLVSVDSAGRSTPLFELTGTTGPSIAVFQGEPYLLEGRWTAGAWEAHLSRVVCRDDRAQRLSHTNAR